MTGLLSCLLDACVIGFCYAMRWRVQHPENGRPPRRGAAFVWIGCLWFGLLMADFAALAAGWP